MMKMIMMMTATMMMTVIMMTEMMVSIRVSSLEGPVTIHHSKSAGKTRCADPKKEEMKINLTSKKYFTHVYMCKRISKPFQIQYSDEDPNTMAY